ncbi:MAG: alpha/beta fold hydrolase [Pseudolabrys sp.]
MPMLSRRATMAGAGAAALLAAQPTKAQPAARKTFVLIHGAYHGGWCWKYVRDLLERAGHRVYAPSLTGQADRSHLLTKDLTMDVHVADIVNLFKWEDLKDACLVAHSFGGFAGSGAADQIHDRLSSVVWLDAFKPKDGEKPLDYISAFSRKALEEAMARGEAGRKPPPAKTYSLVEKEYAWIDSKLTPQPNGPTFQPVHISGKLDRIAKKTYIRAPKYPQASFDRALAECRADKTWQTFVVEDSGHDVMIDKPEWLADTLIKAS